jgi:hypothetical protein
MLRRLCLILVAATLAPLSAAAQAPRADGPTLSVETRAQGLYVTGRDRFHDGDFAGALEDFRRSLDLVDSPNTRMYVGRALRRLGRLPEAFATFDRAARDADRRATVEPRYAATRDSARAEADEIRGDIALLTVRVPGAPPNASIRVAGADVPLNAVGLPLPFAPGEVIVEFDAPGYAPARQILILAPGGESEVALAPRPDDAAAAEATPAAAPRGPAGRVEPPPARPWSTARVLGVTALSAGAATLATGVVFGAMAWSEHETLGAQESPDQGLRARGEFHRDLANVMFASGATLAASSLVLFWLSGRAAADAPRPPVLVDVAFGGGAAALRVGGTL